MRRQRGLTTLMGLAAVGLWMVANSAEARVTTEQSASILVFPKIISDGTQDTIVQITNTSNNVRFAHCFYTDGSLTDPSRPADPIFNPPRWVEIDFDIVLTKQQPTHWVASTGRLYNLLDAQCRANTPCNPGSVGAPNTGTVSAGCCDAGYDPGRVPPVQPGFTGELKCIEVDSAGFPLPGNALKGEATIETIATGDVSKYNAIGLKGFDTNNQDELLCLGGTVTDDCPTGAEYDACPHTWILDHSADGAADLVADNNGIPGSSVATTLTVVPCTQNYETQQPQEVTLNFDIWNEYEQRLSAQTKFQCWGNFPLSEINSAFTENALGGSLAQTRVRSSVVRNPDGSTDVSQGILAIIEESHSVGSAVARSAQNVHTSPRDRLGTDRITIPTGQGGQIFP